MPDLGLNSVRNREEMIRLFDGHSSGALFVPEAKEAGRELVKSYLLETTPSVSGSVDALESAFMRTGHKLKRLDEGLAAVSENGTGYVFGFVEVLRDRHVALYTMLKANEADKWVRSIVSESSGLDRLWLSGKLFEGLWRSIEETCDSRRFVKITFFHESIFAVDGELDSDDSDVAGPEDDLEPTAERTASKFTVVDRISSLRERLPRLRDIYEPLHAISQLRIPAGIGPGGHDFYHDGKVTNRSRSFRDHRLKLVEVVDYYQGFTERIEKVTWTDFEKGRIGQSGARVAGSPVVMKFSSPLDIRTFQQWVKSTFERPRNEFRLWGHPIQVGERKVHVYGLDRHLWQPVYLEMATTHLVAMLPRGTCGNTVHRLVTNVQRYIDPAVTVTVGSKLYMDFAREEEKEPQKSDR